MWSETSEGLSTRLVFKDFIEAWAFMNEVAILAEQMNHHPNWCNTWNVVTIHLNTHSEGNQITSLDHELARGISEILQKYQP